MRNFWIASAAIVGLFSIACASSQVSPDDVSRASNQAKPEASSEEPSTARFDEVPLIKGPMSAEGYQGIFATPDLGVGKNRVGVVVTSPSGLVTSPGATISSLFFPVDGSEAIRKETAFAVFREFPLATRGLYSSDLEFDQPGKWGIEVIVLDESGVGRQVDLQFDVNEKPATPGVGDDAIASLNKTLNDVSDISEITTGSLQDENLYQTTIADAILSGLPTVVVMASPAFCTNAVCGPQVDVLSELEDKYAGQAHFIHVDIYDNPKGIQGDLKNGVISPTVLEWNLPSTEWSFVIDSDGKIAARFEAFATFSEIENALKEVL